MRRGLQTQPNFTSGAATWTPDEGQTWFKLPQVSGYWASLLRVLKPEWFVGNNGQILKISFQCPESPSCETTWAFIRPSGWEQWTIIDRSSWPHI